MSIVHIPFYPSDWLAGTRGMSDAETGVYITLIARMYEMAGPIERDDERLYRLCGCKSKASFRKSLEYLLAEGKVIEVDGGLLNERVQKEIKIATEKSGKAKAAAESRWNRKPNKNNNRTHANASVEHMPQQCQPEPYPESEEKEDPIGSSKKPPPEKPDPPPDETAQPPPARKRAVGLPEGWVPSDRNLEDARKLDFTDKETHDEADQFRDYHRSRGSSFKDWDAAWRTWLRNARKFSDRRVAGRSKPAGRGQGGSLASIAAWRRAQGHH